MGIYLLLSLQGVKRRGNLYFQRRTGVSPVYFSFPPPCRGRTKVGVLLNTNDQRLTTNCNSFFQLLHHIINLFFLQIIKKRQGNCPSRHILSNWKIPFLISKYRSINRLSFFAISYLIIFLNQLTKTARYIFFN